MDGTKLLAKLQETTPKTVKIMVTGYPSMRSAIEAVNRGAQGYILKPIKIENLLNIIRKHLSKIPKNINNEKTERNSPSLSD